MRWKYLGHCSRLLLEEQPLEFWRPCTCPCPNNMSLFPFTNTSRQVPTKPVLGQLQNRVEGFKAANDHQTLDLERFQLLGHLRTINHDYISFLCNLGEVFFWHCPLCPKKSSSLIKSMLDISTEFGLRTQRTAKHTSATHPLTSDHPIGFTSP